MKKNVEVPELDSEAINQEDVDVTDNPPKGLVQELTAAIVTQLKNEGILAGGGGGILSGPQTGPAGAPQAAAASGMFNPMMMGMGGMGGMGGIPPEILQQV